METLETIQRKIRTAQDLYSLVKTMKVLAAVNIRQYEKVLESVADYGRTLETGLRIALRDKTIPAPKRRIVKTVGAFVFGTDQGLCGPLNEQIVSHATEYLDRLGVIAENRTLAAIGFRSAARLELAGYSLEASLSVPGSVSEIAPLAQQLTIILEQWHLEKGINHIILFHSRYLPGGSHRPHALHLTPADTNWLLGLQQKKWPSRVIPSFTMDRDRLLSSLLGEHIFMSLCRAQAESLATENASRLVSMQNAERNIEGRLTELTADFNQKRQTAITEELLDIVAGYSSKSVTGLPEYSPTQMGIPE